MENERLKRYPAALLLLLWWWCVPVACDIDGDLAECPYNARLEYWYTGTGQANVLPDYVYRMDEFVFDSAGVLCHRREISSQKGIAAELKLPPGRYTLVSWGNLDSCSRVSRAKVGETRLEDIYLYADHPFGSAGTRSAGGSVQASTEKLYYGYAAFRIAASGVSRGRVDMVHAHLKLDVAVKWKGRAPSDQGDMYMTLSGVYPQYRFEPEFEVKGSAYSTYSGGGASGGGMTRSGVWYYIPGRPAGCSPVTWKVAVRMDITRQVNAQFVTYRLASDDHPVLTLYGGGVALTKEVDLSRYFETMQIDLDKNLRQEFSLVLEVDGSGGIIVSSATVRDWADGGTIGFGS